MTTTTTTGQKKNVNERPAERKAEATPQQDALTKAAQPQKEHHWLQKLVGEWTFEAEATMQPGTAPEKSTGSESVRSIGGLWIVGEGQGEMPGGGPATTFLTLGYDPLKKRFVGTFMGSMMTNLWVYQGTLDPAQRVLTLETEGPSMIAEGKNAQYRDAIELKSDDHRVMTSHMLGDDGEWHGFMTAHYRRKR
jgi:hypothetical protein